MSALGLYLDALFGAEPAGGYIEVRFKASTGMGQRWFSRENRSGASRSTAFLISTRSLTVLIT